MPKPPRLRNATGGFSKIRTRVFIFAGKQEPGSPGCRGSTPITTILVHLFTGFQETIATFLMQQAFRQLTAC